jgi:hypothetical protein
MNMAFQGDDDSKDHQEWWVEEIQHSFSYEEEIIIEEDDTDEVLLASIGDLMEKEFLTRKKMKSKLNKDISNLLLSPSVSYDEEEILEEIIEDEYEEQVIEKWFQVDFLPEDLESACRQLIPIVYRGEEHMDPDTMMRRTPLPELYKYLKQHYDYKKDVKKEICAETVQQVEQGAAKQCSVQELFQRRAEEAVGAVATGHASTESNRDKGGSDNETTGQPETNEQALKRWLTEDDLPENLEIACKTLIQMVYEDEDVDPAKIMRRTPLPELFRYLKQTYKHNKTTESVTATSGEMAEGGSGMKGLGYGTGGDDANSTGEDEYILEENPEYTSTLPDDSGEYDFEEVLEDSRRKEDLDASLQVLEESAYTEEEVIDNGTSTRSFIEEEVIEEETEVSVSAVGEDYEEEEIYEDEIEVSGHDIV